MSAPGTPDDFTHRSGDAPPADGVQSLKERLEATIQALVEKDMEVIEAHTLLNLMLVGGRPRSQALLDKLQSGELIAPVDLDLEPIRDYLTDRQVRKLSRVLVRYRELREDFASFVGKIVRTGKVAKGQHRRISGEVMDFLEFTEEVKTETWDLFAATDTLTGLMNRSAQARIFAEECRKARRRGSPFCLALIDADHGHDVGDAVLVAIAKRLDEGIRAFDHIFRHGGEEILLLLPRVTRRDADRMMERLRKCIADTPVRLPDGTEITATVSIGYSLLGAEPDLTIDAALQTVDEALYQSKEAGRNRCTFRRHRR
jgi:diguanylate cyclase (GGDEF)-like protein